MTDADALLRAIAEHPDEDTPRLAYADWLQEHGDPDRAEFIRVQIELDRTRGEPGGNQLRERELIKQHGAAWKAELVPPHDDSNVHLRYARGFPDEITFSGVRWAETFALLRRVPLLRQLALMSCDLTLEVVADVAALPALGVLTVSDTRFQPDWLPVLDRLPCWTVVSVDPPRELSELPGWQQAWADFHAWRAARVAALSPDERRHAAERFWLANSSLNRPGRPDGRSPFRFGGIDGREFAWMAILLAELPNLEVYQSNARSTPEFLRVLARLPNLRSVCLRDVEIPSITPLADCPGLERLFVTARNYDYPSDRCVFGDEGTVGLERLTGLRRLSLRAYGHGDSAGGFGDATVRRLAPLRELESLDLLLGAIADEECLGCLAGLTRLESLSLGPEPVYGVLPWAVFSDRTLRHLAPLRRLRSLSTRVAAGDGGGFRHLAGLTNLTELGLSGPGITDDSLGHLATLTNLRTLRVEDSPVTADGARALAARLPGVMIVHDNGVLRPARPTLAFRRRQHSPAVSVLWPTHWPDLYGGWHAAEDGWDEDGVLADSVLGPATIRLDVSDRGRRTAHDVLREYVENDLLAGSRWSNSRRDDQGDWDDEDRRRGPPHPVLSWTVPELVGNGRAACVCREDHDRRPGVELRCLLCAVVSGGTAAVFRGEVFAPRFEEFRRLFAYVARSLRVGKAAAKGIGEEVVVAASEL